MYRYVVHTWEPAPALEGDRWITVLCPPEADVEYLGERQCRFRLGCSLITITLMDVPFLGQPGPAFEVTAGDELSPHVASQLMSAMWDRFSRAVTREIPLPNGRSMSACNAHLLTMEVPDGAYPLGQDE